MALKNNLVFERYGDFINIEDTRWRRTTTGMHDGQNGILKIDDAAKAEGGHRVNGYLKSGTPVYKDTDGYVKVWNATAKGAGKKILGFLQSVNQIQSRSGVFFDEIAVGIQTSGSIYSAWLPVKIDAEDIPVLFDNSTL